jgi:photosystem II stability/assembly factor-like uncharacterized protein
VEVTQAKLIDAKNFQSLKWRNIGPFRGGRANGISGVPGNNQLYFVGYTGGGVWKTRDAGLNWENISDGFFKTSTIGDIAVSESDPNVIYVGTGEHAVRGVMTTFGDGVYKSTDQGKTWKNMGLETTRHISDVIIHPENPDIVWVAAQGALHGPSEDRGVYKSIDGGVTWKKTLFVDQNTGVSSLTVDFSNPRIMYAATWEHRRLPWQVQSGGNGCAVWKSTDGGETWGKAIEGLPALMGKIGLSVSRAEPSRVYAIVEAEKSKAGVYRSDDAGKSWKLMTNDQTLTARSWYYMEIFADPSNPEIVYVLNAPAMRSIDGGKTFSMLRVGHGDTHDLWINPHDSNNLALADDGGGEISFNSGRTWSPQGNQPTAQFYRVNTDNRFPYWVYGGQQDNTSVMIQSRTNGSGITDKDWTAGPGCESAFLAFNPDHPTQIFGGCYQGYIEVLNMANQEVKDIMAYPALNLAIAPKDMKYRFNWNAPIIASPHDYNTIYHAANKVLKTTDGGISWTEISPDLTRNEPEKQIVGGGPITNEGAGGENYHTIYYLIESALEKDLIWAGSDCGLVHITRNGGKSWENVTPAGLPECLIQSIEVSPHQAGTAYISATRYKFNDFSSMAYKTNDYGKTWVAINKGIEKDDYIRVIREDLKVPGLLYGGAERAFYISADGGLNWSPFQLNFPVVGITDLTFRDNDLIASTAGRAFWILDDLGAIQQSKGFPEGKVQLYTPKETYRYGSAGYGGGRGNMGENPAEGVILDYYLGEKVDSMGLKLELFNAEGKLLRTLSSLKPKKSESYPGGPPPPVVLPTQVGVNRFAWDMRTETLPGIQNVFVQGDLRGYKVSPGLYKAKLTGNGVSSEISFIIKLNPATTITKEDWAAQQFVLEKIDSEVKEVHQMVNKIRLVKKQILLQEELLQEHQDAKDLLESGKSLLKKLEDWESEVIETRQKNFQDVINWPSKLNGELLDLKSRIDANEAKLTGGAKQRLTDLNAKWSMDKSNIERIIREDLPEYSKKFQDKGLPSIILIQ